VYFAADNLIQVQSFFRACLRENGILVPGSERIGHNVLTNNGREWLSELIGWRDINDPDVEFTNRRVRWIGVGDDSHAAVTEAVNTLKNPVTVTTSPDLYLTELDAPPNFLSPVWVRFSRTLGTAEVSHPGQDPIVIKEAGLCVDHWSVINGDFTNWTADDPDNWALSLSGSADVTERGPTQGNGGAGTGACNLYRPAGTDTIIMQQSGIPVVDGQDYEVHFDIGFASGGPLRCASPWFGVQFSSTGHQVISFTAQGSSLLLQFNSVAAGASAIDFTIDNVNVYPAGKGVGPGQALNPVVAYKAFDGLLKSSAFTLDLEWSFRF